MTLCLLMLIMLLNHVNLVVRLSFANAYLSGNGQTGPAGCSAIVLPAVNGGGPQRC